MTGYISAVVLGLLNGTLFAAARTGHLGERVVDVYFEHRVKNVSNPLFDEFVIQDGESPVMNVWDLRPIRIRVHT